MVVRMRTVIATPPIGNNKLSRERGLVPTQPLVRVFVAFRLFNFMLHPKVNFCFCLVKYKESEEKCNGEFRKKNEEVEILFASRQTRVSGLNIFDRPYTRDSCAQNSPVPSRWRREHCHLMLAWVTNCSSRTLCVIASWRKILLLENKSW